MVDLRGEHLVTRAPHTKFTFYTEGFGAAKSCRILPETVGFKRSGSFHQATKSPDLPL